MQRPTAARLGHSMGRLESTIDGLTSLGKRVLASVKKPVGAGRAAETRPAEDPAGANGPPCSQPARIVPAGGYRGAAGGAPVRHGDEEESAGAVRGDAEGHEARPGELGGVAEQVVQDLPRPPRPPDSNTGKNEKEQAQRWRTVSAGGDTFRQETPAPSPPNLRPSHLVGESHGRRKRRRQQASGKGPA